LGGRKEAKRVPELADKVHKTIVQRPREKLGGPILELDRKMVNAGEGLVEYLKGK